MFYASFWILDPFFFQYIYLNVLGFYHGFLRIGFLFELFFSENRSLGEDKYEMGRAETAKLLSENINFSDIGSF